jgi:hypothetical protein
MRLEAELGAAREQWSQNFWDRWRERQIKSKLINFRPSHRFGNWYFDAVTDTLAVDCGQKLGSPPEASRGTGPLARLPEHLAAASAWWIWRPGCRNRHGVP